MDGSSEDRWWVVFQPPTNNPAVWNIAEYRSKEEAIVAAQIYLSSAYGVMGLYDRHSEMVLDANALRSLAAKPDEK